MLAAQAEKGVLWHGSVGVLSGDSLFQPGISYFRRLRVYSLGEPPLAAWEFEEAKGASCGDATGHGNNGKLEGGVQWTSGRDGGAVRLDGIDDFIRIPDGPWQSGMEYLSIHALFKLHSLPSRRGVALVGKGGPRNALDAPEDRSYYLNVQPSTSQLRFVTDNGTELGRWAAVSDCLPLDQWIEVVATYNGARNVLQVRVGRDNWRRYEGFLLLLRDQGFAIPDSDRPLQIGCEAQHRNFLDATIDWVRLRDTASRAGNGAAETGSDAR